MSRTIVATFAHHDDISLIVSPSDVDAWLEYLGEHLPDDMLADATDLSII